MLATKNKFDNVKNVLLKLKTGEIIEIPIVWKKCNMRANRNIMCTEITIRKYKNKNFNLRKKYEM